MRRLILGLAFAWIALPVAAQDMATTIAAAAHAACQTASDAVGRMYPGLQQTWRDNDAAQQVLAAAHERLHLASAPLQNSDCAGAGFGAPQCLKLDADYRAAREAVLQVEPAAGSAARTYAINLARYQAAADAATRLCVTAAAADAARAGGAVADNVIVGLIQDILAQANGLIAALDPATDAAVPVAAAPSEPTPVAVPVPPPPADAAAPETPSVSVTGSQEANLTWMWQFNAVTFNGTYTGDFSTSWTFSGSSVSGNIDVTGTVQCTGRNVPVEGWEGGEGRMDCTATFPPSATHGPLTWRGSGGGLANYDGFLVKGAGAGTYADDTGTHESSMEVFSVRPGLAPT